MSPEYQRKNYPYATPIGEAETTTSETTTNNENNENNGNDDGGKQDGGTQPKTPKTPKQ
nr:MAG TPA: hypothetical protein [Caudoviricetes sp.]